MNPPDNLPPATGVESCVCEDTAPEQWRSQCLVARIQRDAAYAKIRECVTRLEECADRYAETREAIADISAILRENAES